MCRLKTSTPVPLQKKTRVDSQPRMGEFVLTGSQPFGLLSHITQSLAGQMGLVQLLPFAVQELQAAQWPAQVGPLRRRRFVNPTPDLRGRRQYGARRRGRAVLASNVTLL